jgi:hypothetical protein
MAKDERDHRHAEAPHLEVDLTRLPGSVLFGDLGEKLHG